MELSKVVVEWAKGGRRDRRAPRWHELVDNQTL
jgi:hypothetical protein